MNHRRDASALDPAGPISIEGIMRDAVAAFRGGQLEAAEAGARRIVGLRPGYAPALHLLGVVVSRTGQRSEGIALLRKAVALEPRDVEAANYLGHLLRLEGRPA